MSSATPMLLRSAAPERAAGYEELAAPFRPTFDRIAENAVQREIVRRLPFQRWSGTVSRDSRL